MPERDLDLLIRAARGAGEIATTFTGPSAKRWDKDDGAGPVTEADLAVDAYLRTTLCSARPDYGWLSEESADTGDRLRSETVFIIDPIDGTRSFIEGSNTWAHSLAIARGGTIVAGVVFLPLRDKLYAAALGEGATLNGAPTAASTARKLERAELLCAKPNLDKRFWKDGAAPGFRRAYRPSLAYRLALVAEGRFDGMITFRPTWEWDVAAGSLIASEAGAQVSCRRGAALRFNSPERQTHGIITAAPALHTDLLTRHEPER